MFGLFSKFEKVVKTVRGYTYKRKGKRVKVASHQRTVTQRKAQPKPPSRQASKGRKPQPLPPLPRLIPYNEMSPESRRRYDENFKRQRAALERSHKQEEIAKLKAKQPKPSAWAAQKRWVKRGDIIEVFTFNDWRMVEVQEVKPDCAYCIDYFSDGYNGWHVYIWNKPEHAHLWRYSDW